MALNYVDICSLVTYSHCLHWILLVVCNWTVAPNTHKPHIILFFALVNTFFTVYRWRRKRKHSTTFVERTRKGHCQSNIGTISSFHGNLGETSERWDGVHTLAFPSADAILNWTDLTFWFPALDLCLSWTLLAKTDLPGHQCLVQSLPFCHADCDCLHLHDSGWGLFLCPALVWSSATGCLLILVEKY